MIGVVVGVFLLSGIIWLFGKALDMDLREIIRVNPKYRKYLKNKLKI